MSEDFFQFRRFRLELEGVTQGGFESFVLPAGPGGSVRLLRGVANTRELFGWFQAVLTGTPELRRADVVELADDGEERRRHVLDGAFPLRVRVATLTADALFEVDELELAVGVHQEEPAGRMDAPEPSPEG